LETINIGSDRNLIDFRLPVQYVIRPHQDLRAYAGQIEGGVIRKGEEVVILPSKQESVVKSIIVDGKERDYAFNPEAVAIVLKDEVDVSRGDMIVRKNNIPEIGTEINSMVCWMDSEELKEGKTYIIKHNTKITRCVVRKINYRLNIEDLHREETNKLKFNEIGRIQISTNDPLMFDPYNKNKNTGSFILIDEMSYNTIGGGIVLTKTKKINEENENKKQGAVVWFTGLSGSGKSTIADEVYKKLQSKNIPCERLDGDTLRENITANLDFSKEGRERNIEIAGFVAKMLAKHGVIVLASFISPYKKQRKKLRKNIDNFVEVFVNTPLSVCEERDIKGLYKKARQGEIADFTGVSHPYEEPENPELEVRTAEEDLEKSVEKIMDYLSKKII